jgi:hypothetical protein
VVQAALYINAAERHVAAPSSFFRFRPSAFAADARSPVFRSAQTLRDSGATHCNHLGVVDGGGGRRSPTQWWVFAFPSKQARLCHCRQTPVTIRKATCSQKVVLGRGQVAWDGLLVETTNEG